MLLLIIPLLSSLLFIGSYIWDNPYTKIDMGILSILNVLMISVFLISRHQKNEYDGQIVITDPDDGPKRFTLELNDAPEDLEKKDSVIFKIVPSIEESL